MLPFMIFYRQILLVIQKSLVWLYLSNDDMPEYFSSLLSVKNPIVEDHFRSIWLWNIKKNKWNSVKIISQFCWQEWVVMQKPLRWLQIFKDGIPQYCSICPRIIHLKDTFTSTFSLGFLTNLYLITTPLITLEHN